MLFIDASMVFHRALCKLDFLKNSAGTHTGMEFGTFKILESLAAKFPGKQIVLCFDHGSSKRKALDSNYKGNRSPVSEDFKNRSNELRKILSEIYKTAYKEGEEADEVIYSLAGQRNDCYIYSNDDDLLQAVDDERKIQVVKSFESKLYFWDEQKIREKYLIGPSLIAIFRSFTGDSSDNIPGIPRINKRLLAEALYFATEHWDCGDIFSFLKIVKEHNLFSDNMKRLVIDFIDNGRFVLNYQLTKLMSFPVQIKHPTNNIDTVKDFLNKLEIRSLKICETVGMKNIEIGDEF